MQEHEKLNEISVTMAVQDGGSFILMELLNQSIKIQNVSDLHIDGPIEPAKQFYFPSYLCKSHDLLGKSK